MEVLIYGGNIKIETMPSKSKRESIQFLRDKVKETNADSTYSNKFLYNCLMEHARWLVRREINKGNIYVNNSFFQILECQKVIEVPTTGECCPIKTGCTTYRTKEKLPEAWIDTNGPVIRSVTSIDGSTDIFYTTPTTWTAKKNDPYQKMIDEKYTFFADGYLWFPGFNPHLVNIEIFSIEDVEQYSQCKEKTPCFRFLDGKFMVPEWLEAEMYAKAVEQLAGVTKRLPQDQEVNKNETRK